MNCPVQDAFSCDVDFSTSSVVIRKLFMHLSSGGDTDQLFSKCLFMYVVYTLIWDKQHVDERM